MKARRRHLALALAAVVAAAGVPAAMAASGGGAAPPASGSALHAGRTMQECKEIWPGWTEQECESWVKEGTTTTTTSTATTSTSSSSKSFSSSTTTSTNTASKSTSASSSYGSEPTSTSTSTTSTSTSSEWPTTGTSASGEPGSKASGSSGRRPCSARGARHRRHRARQHSSTCARSAAAVVVGTKRAGRLGTILEAGSRGHTVYAFMADHRNRSVCRGACEQLWPPVTTSGRPKASRGAKSKSLGTIARGHGVRQVTYDGRPLYYYLPDRSSKDVRGEGVKSFGARWFALSPRGKIAK